jgi:hypothetical protein
MGYIFELEEELLMLLPGLISGVPSGLFGIAAYILTALAIYRISCRRGLNNPWLAWIPVVNCWLLGSLSDQYQYVVKGENKSKRKWLIVLNILKSVLMTLAVILAVVTAGSLFADHPSEVIGLVVALLGLVVPLAAVTIALCVVRYMALYDVYRSLDPANAVLYLVLSILFSPTEPFFLFFNREKDLGMPPRKRQPVYEQETTYETVDAEYL